MNERLPLDLRRFLITSLGAKRIGEKPSSVRLRSRITARQGKRLAGTALGLVGIALREPQSPAFYPQQRVVRLDAQGTIERGRCAVEIALRNQRMRLRHQ